MSVTDGPTETALAPSTGGIDWPLVGFFALAYVIAWGLLGVLDLVAVRSGVESGLVLLSMGEAYDFQGATLVVPEWTVYLVTRVIDFSFSIAGVVVVAATAGRAGLRELFGRLVRLDFPRRWWLLALVPLVLYALAAAVAITTDPAVPATVDLTPAALSAALFALNGGLIVTLLLRGPMGEELGLRGFALVRLQTRTTPFLASVVIGVFWALWHLPVLLGRGVVELVVFLLLAFVLAFVFTWLFNGARGSLLPVLVFHTIQNSEEMVETVLPGLVGTDWELVSSLGLLVLGVGVVVWLFRQGYSGKTVEA